MNLQAHVQSILRDYNASRKGSPLAFVRVYRRFAAIPGLTSTKAMQLAKTTFPKEHEAYQAAKARGEALPPLDREADLQKRLSRAVRTGVIN